MSSDRLKMLAFVAIGFFAGVQILNAMVHAAGEWAAIAQSVPSDHGPAAPLSEVEFALRPISKPKNPPGPSDWLKNHPERNQSFLEYYSRPVVRPDEKRKVIHLCLVGEFTPTQRQILEKTRKYIETFFQVPTRISRSIPLSEIPASAQRNHPTWGMHQLQSRYFLFEVLKKDIPDDALAYVAFTAEDLFPDHNWNFVFGEASLVDRTGIWSIHRNGNPDENPGAYRLCLKRTMGVASHEISHILSIPHCVAFECVINGGNTQDEMDRAPLHACPVCTRKLCWNLRVEPIRRHEALRAFYQDNGFGDEAAWCTRAIQRLTEIEKARKGDD